MPITWPFMLGPKEVKGKANTEKVMDIIVHDTTYRNFLMIGFITMFNSEKGTATFAYDYFCRFLFNLLASILANDGPFQK